MLSAKVNIPVEDPAAVIKSLQPDMEDAGRFEVKISPLEKEIEIEIKADDVSALRAAFNSYTRLIKIVTSVEEK